MSQFRDIVQQVLVRRLVIILALAVVAVTIGAWLAIPHVRLSPHIKTVARRVQRVAREFAVKQLAAAPTDAQATVESLASQLVQALAREQNDDKANEALERDVLRVVVGLLQAWSTSDPDVYLAWADAHGMALPSKLPAYQAWNMTLYRNQHRGVVGREAPATITPEEYFRAYFRAYFQRMQGALRPAAVSIEPNSAELRVQRYTHWGDEINSETIENGLGGEFWYGQIGYSGMALTWPKSVLADQSAKTDDADMWRIGTLNDAKRMLFQPLLDQGGGSFLAAKVMLVYRSATGLNVPLTVWLAQRPTDQTWFTTGLAISNVDSDAGVLPGHAYMPPF